jgi:predicted glycosyltransferase
MQRRILIYSGRDEPEAAARALALARAVLRREPEATCVLAARGVAPVADPPVGLALLELPTLVPTPAGSAEPAQAGGPQAARVGLRLLTDLALSFQPDVVVVDRDPLGALGELATALAALSAMAPPPRTWLAMDDLDLIRASRRPGALRALERTAGRYGALLVFGEADACAPFVTRALAAARVPTVAYAGYGGFAAAGSPPWSSHVVAGRRTVVAPAGLVGGLALGTGRFDRAVAGADLVVAAVDHPAVALALAHGRSLVLLAGARARDDEGQGTEHLLRARTLEQRGRARVLDRATIDRSELLRLAAVAGAIPPPPDVPSTADRAAGLLLDTV